MRNWCGKSNCKEIARKPSKLSTSTWKWSRAKGWRTESWSRNPKFWSKLMKKLLIESQTLLQEAELLKKVKSSCYKLNFKKKRESKKKNWKSNKEKPKDPRSPDVNLLGITISRMWAVSTTTLRTEYQIRSVGSNRREETSRFQCARPLLWRKAKK